MAREPQVPLVVFNQMNNNLLRLIEQEGKARRDHEERIAQLFANAADTIAAALTPREHTYEPSPTKLHMSEEEEDLRFLGAQRGFDKDAVAEALAELELMAGTNLEIE